MMLYSLFSSHATCVNPIATISLVNLRSNNGQMIHDAALESFYIHALIVAMNSDELNLGNNNRFKAVARYT